MSLGLVKISNSKATKLKDFTALQTQVAKADPEGVTMSKYTSSNKIATCPDVNSKWGANSTLPPTPSSDACSCMVKSSSCVPASGLDTDDYSDIFDYICGKDADACAGINGNSTTGVYGTYSMCSDVDKLAYVLNAYYVAQDKASDACDFDGKAQTQTASTSDNCDELATSASGSNSSSSSSSDDDSAAAMGASMNVGFGLVALLLSVGLTSL